MDVLLIAGKKDLLAAHLAAALSSHHIACTILDGLSAARVFTIHREGSAVSVEPGCPVFVRPSAWDFVGDVKSADERFLRAEAFASVWATAALLDSTVINRPHPAGATRMLRSDIIAELKVGQSGDAEVHASGPEMFTVTEALWGENVESGFGPIELMPTGIPLRARRIAPDARYEVVTVVGKRAFSATLDPRVTEFELLEKSISLAENFNFHFASVTWSIEGSLFNPIRVNAAPGFEELRHNWTQVIDALSEDLVA